MNEAIGRLLAVGNVAEVFEYGCYVVKLYKSVTAKSAVFREAALHGSAEELGLPVPRIWSVREFRNRWGLVFDQVEYSSFAEKMSALYLAAMVHLHTQIHAQKAIHFASLKLRLAVKIGVSRFLTSIDGKTCWIRLPKCQTEIAFAMATSIQ